MISIIKDSDELDKLTLLPYFDTFSRFDDGGKIGFLSCVYRKLVNRENFLDLANNEKEFAEGLAKALKTSGVMATLSVVEGSGTYSWQRGCNLIDVVREAEKILNGKHEGKPNTTLTPEYYETIQSYD
jgi:hypothetical protein